MCSLIINVSLYACHNPRRSDRMCSLTVECVLWLKNVLSYYRMCPLTIECVLSQQVTIIDFEVINFINFETEIRYAESSGIVQVFFFPENCIRDTFCGKREHNTICSKGQKKNSQKIVLETHSVIKEHNTICSIGQKKKVYLALSECVCVCVHTCVCTRHFTTCECVCVHIHIHVCVHIHIHVCSLAIECVHTAIESLLHAYVYTYTYYSKRTHSLVTEHIL